MPQFRYRALTHAGEAVVGEIEAPTREEVVRRIEYLGHLPIEAEIAAPRVIAFGIARARKRVPAREVTVFLRQLSLLAGAGLTVESALQTLGENAGKGVAEFAGAIRASISAGDSLAEAMERHPGVIEPAYAAMLRAGEASGKLVPVLKSIVDDRVRRERLSDRVNSTIRYPLFLVASAIAILLFFLGYVVPQFESVFTDLGTRLNAGAATVLALSRWLNGNLELFVGACLALAASAWIILASRPARALMMAAATSIPGVGAALNDRRAARIIGMIELLLENGVTLPVTLRILRDIVADPRHVTAVDQLYDQVRNGRRFADALAETDLLPPLAVRMLRVGDETGDLISIAKHAARFYEHQFETGLDRLMGAIGPVTIILVSIIVGGLVVSIMSALLSITELAL